MIKLYHDDTKERNNDADSSFHLVFLPLTILEGFRSVVTSAVIYCDMWSSRFNYTLLLCTITA